MKCRMWMVLIPAIVLWVAGCEPQDGDAGVARLTASGKYTGADIQAMIEGAKEKVFPTLVYVKPIREDYSEGKKQRMVVSGSGVIISSDGYVVTNNHVAEKAVEIRCVLFDNTMLKADLIGTDKDTDLALLKLKPEDGVRVFPYAALADSNKVVEGKFVMALGSPWGLKRSISLGIVSSAERFLENDSEYSLWIQSDAALNPGNSGGPLVNTDGEVIGINTLATMMGGDMGFSVPSNTVRYVVEQLKEHGEVKRSWTGLRLQPLRDFDSDSFFEGERGVLVASVDPGSPAEKAGLEVGDLILSVNGEPTNGLYSENLPHIRTILGRLPTGQPVEVAIERGGKPSTVSLTTSEKGLVEGEDLELKRWNMTVKSINEHADPQLYYYVKQGVYVQGVSYPGNAALAGFSGRGEIVLKADGKEIKTLDDIKKAYDEIMADTKRKKRVAFEIMRGGMPSMLVLDYARDYDKE
ncbi:MAG: trypsin-like peptidase domain-containing protein [Planctomycetes bacterium]|nr:trypsin-like peptidase domain-containing protein [Planctomycetota bacterium]